MLTPFGFPVVMALSAAIPLLVALFPGAGERDFAFVLALGISCYSGFRLALTILGAQVRLLQGAFWLFTYIAMGIAPLAQLVLDRFPTPLAAPEWALTTALFMTLLGCVAYDAGTQFARIRHSGARSEPARRQFTWQRLWLLSGVALLASAVLVVSLGGPATFFSSRQAISTALEATGGDGQVQSALLRGFGTVPVLVALLVTTRWLRVDPQKRRRFSTWILWGTLAVANLVVNNPISNPRYWFLTVAFAVVFVSMPHSLIVFRSVLLIGAAAAVLLFPFADRFRYEAGANPTLQPTSWIEPLAVKDYDQLVMVANAVGFARVGPGHTGGEQTLGALLFWVPRSLWPGKAQDTGVVLGQWVGTQNVNLSAPLWAEMWLDFTTVGLVLVFLGLGYISSRIDLRYHSAAGQARLPGDMLSVIVPLAAGYQFILLRGSLLQAMGRVGILLIVLAIATVRLPQQTDDDRQTEGDVDGAAQPGGRADSRSVSAASDRHTIRSGRAGSGRL
jgi:hypothetical protein